MCRENILYFSNPIWCHRSCCMGNKPLAEPTWTECQLDLWEHIFALSWHVQNFIVLGRVYFKPEHFNFGLILNLIEISLVGWGLVSVWFQDNMADSVSSLNFIKVLLTKFFQNSYIIIQDNATPSELSYDMAWLLVLGRVYSFKLGDAYMHHQSRLSKTQHWFGLDAPGQPIKGHLHQCGKTRGAPARIRPAGSAVDRCVEIVWCC